MKPIPTNIILVAAAQPPLRAADALGLLQAAYTNESLPEPVSRRLCFLDLLAVVICRCCCSIRGN